MDLFSRTDTLYVNGQDAAYAGDIAPGAQVIFGYFGGPNAYHVWDEADWDSFPGYKVPIWVAGFNGQEEGTVAVATLKALGVPTGKVIALDMEGRIDKTYVIVFGTVLQAAGYKIMVYGEASTVFGNPPLNGYWVADWTGTPHMVNHPSVRVTQWADGPGHDNDLVKAWTVREMWV